MELTDKLQKLIEKTMDQYLDNPRRTPTADELLKIAEAIAHYDKLTRVFNYLSRK